MQYTTAVQASSFLVKYLLGTGFIVAKTARFNERSCRFKDAAGIYGAA
jgi:hypothetical protein